MQIRIGVNNAPRELTIELGDEADVAELKARVEAALSDDDNVLWVTDKKDQQYAVPSERIGYVVIGSPQSEPRIGFGN